MTTEQIAKVLEKHRKWLADEAGGERADLRGANLRGADLRGAYLRGADLRGAYLRVADLGDADLRGAYLRGAYLRGADLRGAYLGGADLGGANLRGADLGGAYLGGADLGDADLRGAYLRGADLRGADLMGANLRGADLGGADLRGANLGYGFGTWEQFVSNIPAFLGGGGVDLAVVCTREHLECHGWNNCPTAVAYQVNSVGGVPPLIRPFAAKFIELFDAYALTPETIAEACGVELDL